MFPLIAGGLGSEEAFWPSTSELCPNAESHSEERKQLEEYITSVGEVPLHPWF